MAQGQKGWACDEYQARQFIKELFYRLAFVGASQNKLKLINKR